MYYVKKKASFLAWGRRAPQLVTIDTNSVDCSNGDWGKDTFMDLVNIDVTLKNIGTYWEVYCFIAEEDRANRSKGGTYHKRSCRVFQYRHQ